MTTPANYYDCMGNLVGRWHDDEWWVCNQYKPLGQQWYGTESGEIGQFVNDEYVPWMVCDKCGNEEPDTQAETSYTDHGLFSACSKCGYIY